MISNPSSPCWYYAISFSFKWNVQCAFFFLIPSGSRILYSVLFFLYVHSSARRCCNNPQYTCAVVEPCVFIHTCLRLYVSCMCLSCFLECVTYIPLTTLVCTTDFVPDLIAFAIITDKTRGGEGSRGSFRDATKQERGVRGAFWLPFGQHTADR